MAYIYGASDATIYALHSLMRTATLVASCTQECTLGLTQTVLRRLPSVFYAVDFFEGKLHLHFRGDVRFAIAEAAKAGFTPVVHKKSA